MQPKGQLPAAVVPSRSADTTPCVATAAPAACYSSCKKQPKGQHPPAALAAVAPSTAAPAPAAAAVRWPCSAAGPVTGSTLQAAAAAPTAAWGATAAVKRWCCKAADGCVLLTAAASVQQHPVPAAAAAFLQGASRKTPV